MKNVFLHPCTPPILNLLVCWFQNIFFLAGPSKLSWGRTFEFCVPWNGLIMVNPGPKQLCPEYSCWLILTEMVFFGIVQVSPNVFFFAQTWLFGKQNLPEKVTRLGQNQHCNKILKEQQKERNKKPIVPFHAQENMPIWAIICAGKVCRMILLKYHKYLFYWVKLIDSHIY